MAWDAPVKAPNDPLLSADWNAMVPVILGKVPYVGATANVNLGAHTLTAGTLTAGSGSITDTSGTISFGDENLTTTGLVGIGAAVTANYRQIIYAAATDQRALSIDGADRTGALGYGAAVFVDMAQSIGPGQQNVTCQGLDFSVLNSREIEWVGRIGASSISTTGITGFAQVIADHEGALTVVESIRGIRATVIRWQSATGVLATQTSTMIGSDITVLENMDTDGGTYNLGMIGTNIVMSCAGTEVAGTKTATLKGISLDVTCGSDGTTLAYGIFINRVLGADTVWAIYNAAAASNFLGQDNSKSFFGTAQDASIYYDGTDFYIDSQEVGTGHIVLNSPKTTTGDPAGVEGKIYWNTFDNAIKMYADGAWRTLAAW